ncbi:DinB family protein [Marinimicrobium sp. C6131]|uniref:DinB family protein n=1 Tax=Marinimicrobium sp. C6131 TaxID=3022676 RepID=UPI00223E70DF|nr:DinB family protein [Marinimicrobium sp. C6131]UZJ44443.1 DinB family protein [Marinimicrobium sp. C6131]
MISVEYARTMSAYNRWMNERLYETCGDLSDEERKADRGAFFRSIHGTLNHILLADRVWLGRFTGEPFAFNSLDQELYSDFAQLLEERRTTDNAIASWAGNLTEDALATPLIYTRAGATTSTTYPLWVVVAHLFNHQTHHRGQITTLLNQAGHDMGVTDLIRLPEVASGELA